MSREEYRARSKKVQKLGRDGLVEQDKATGQEQRISQRVADISFGPDRAPEQGPVQRTPAHGKKRRQQRPPAPPPEAEQADASGVARNDVSDVSGAENPPPAMRGADDTPAKVPSSFAQDADRSKKRRHRKQIDKLRQEAEPEDGRLQFEPGNDSSPDDADSEESESDPAAPHRTDDVPVRGRSPGRSVPPPAHRRTKSGNRLRFEPECGPDPAKPNTQTRQRTTDAADTSEKFQPHDDASPSDPAAGLSRRQRMRYEKAEQRVEQSGRRLEKAQAKIPTKCRARLEAEYDTNTGRMRRRLRFEAEAATKQTAPSLSAQAGGAVKTAAVMKLHGKLRESEQENVAVEAAHKGEFAAERGAGRLLRWNKQRLRSKPYRAVRQAEHRLVQDRAELSWQTTLRDNPELRSKNPLSKWMQKQKFKHRYAQAAREAQKTAQHTQQAATATGKIARAVQQFAAAHKGVLLIAAALGLVIAFFSAGLASCTVMMSGVESASVSTAYLADDQEICDSELYFTEMEADLQLDIANTEVNHPSYDEYRYNIGEISHNPYELMNYLSATYNIFSFEQVRPEIERLFAEKYQLTRTTVTETRYDDEGNPYEWRVLQTTLTVKRLGDSLSASLASGEQTERYNLYQQTYGNRQAFANPFDFPWLGYVSSGYGWRVHPTTGAKDLHRGVDIAAAQGTAIKAVQDGRVVSAGDAGSYGLCVVIEDDNGYQSRYAHCSSLSVSAGQEVKRGDVIGAVGSTGDSTGPHLHLEVMRNGEYLNPYYFVDNGDDGTGGASPGALTIPGYSGTPMGDERFQAMIAEAEKYLGFPYVWGGTNPSTSFDCSGYVSWVINHSGWNYGRLGVMGLEDICTPVSAADAKPGDLVFFIGTYDAPYPNRPTHVGIYVGNGTMIHCGDPISYTNINTPYWQNHFYGFGRLPMP